MDDKKPVKVGLLGPTRDLWIIAILLGVVALGFSLTLLSKSDTEGRDKSGTSQNNNPGNNKVGRVPDYYLHETEKWLVFPHELAGLSVKEIVDNKPGVDALRALLLERSAKE